MNWIDEKCDICGTEHAGACAAPSVQDATDVFNEFAGVTESSGEDFLEVEAPVAHRPIEGTLHVPTKAAQRSKAYRERHGETVKTRNRERMRAKRVKGV